LAEILSIAKDAELTSYDVVYLYLSKQKGGVLITADEKGGKKESLQLK
jgi:predicted nucleic acid-binding protein